jgi:hypothetical protein
MERQDLYKPGFGRLPVPAALELLTAELHFTHYFPRLSFREPLFRALPLEVNAVTARALEDESVGVVHTLF